ncbi:MAG TPA: hypothetical protein VJ846_12305 [Sphingomicrobium sp.]|nr:hypothetical protein [Sphingomicrobium sp.]
MATTVQARTPVHLWIVGTLALLWNCFGAYDYVMTRTHNMAYITQAMPGTDPNAALAWIEGMPMYAQVGWGLGVWGGVLGAVLLLARSRYALWAFAVSMLGIVLGMGYQLLLAPPLAGASGGKYIQYMVILVGAGLLAYSQAMVKRAVLR